MGSHFQLISEYINPYFGGKNKMIISELEIAQSNVAVSKCVNNSNAKTF